jgi:hypothetical protein
VPGRLRGAGVPQRHDRMLRATGLDSAGRRCGWRFECTVGARFRGQCTVGARFRGQRLEHTMQQLLEGQQMQPQGCEEQMPQKEGVHEMPGVLWPLRQRLIVLVAYYVMHAYYGVNHTAVKRGSVEYLARSGPEFYFFGSAVCGLRTSDSVKGIDERNETPCFSAG